MATASTRLEGILKKTGLFTDDQVSALLDGLRSGSENITSLVVGKGYATEEVFLQLLASALEIQFVKLGETTIEPAVLESLPTKVVFQYNVIPVAIEKGVIVVATHDPFNAELVDVLRMAAGKRVRMALSTSADIAKAAKTFYGVGADTVEKMIEDDRIEVDENATLLKSDLSQMDQELNS